MQTSGSSYGNVKKEEDAFLKDFTHVHMTTGPHWFGIGLHPSEAFDHVCNTYGNCCRELAPPLCRSLAQLVPREPTKPSQHLLLPPASAHVGGHKHTMPMNAHSSEPKLQAATTSSSRLLALLYSQATVLRML
eukprot:359668-Amphidinium_carterae.1